MYAVLPKKAKPSKAASKDQMRPVLTRGELRETEEGWELVVTDSYKLARVRLEVKDDPSDEPLEAGPISAEALRAIEKAGAFRANGTVIPVDQWGCQAGPAFSRDEVGQYPNYEQLMPEVESEAFEIGVNAAFLAQLAEALGSAGTKAPARLTFTMVGGKPSPRGPITVHVGQNGVGLLMPVRLS